jgi:hypothetical protein
VELPGAIGGNSQELERARKRNQERISRWILQMDAQQSLSAW